MTFEEISKLEIGKKYLVVPLHLNEDFKEIKVLAFCKEARTVKIEPPQHGKFWVGNNEYSTWNSCNLIEEDNSLGEKHCTNCYYYREPLTCLFSNTPNSYCDSGKQNWRPKEEDNSLGENKSAKTKEQENFDQKETCETCRYMEDWTICLQKECDNYSLWEPKVEKSCNNCKHAKHCWDEPSIKKCNHPTGEGCGALKEKWEPKDETNKLIDAGKTDKTELVPGDICYVWDETTEFKGQVIRKFYGYSKKGTLYFYPDSGLLKIESWPFYELIYSPSRKNRRKEMDSKGWRR